MSEYRCVLFGSILAVCVAALVVPSPAAFAQEPGRRPQPVVEVDPQYRFGPMDVLQVDVWGRPDLSGVVTIDVEGRVQIPLVGEVRAEGRNAAELGSTLSERYQLVDASVSEVLVSVAQYNSRNLTILGEVRSGGYFGFRELPDLIEALVTAGGPTAGAELALVQIVRRAPGAGEPRTIVVDLSRGLDGIDPATLPELRSGDRIIVPAVEDVPVGGDRVHVIGAVNSPGVYRITAARNVVEALTASGGFSSEAALDRVYLTRVTAMGTVAYRLDIENYLKKAEPLSNMELMPGDTITVMEKSSFMKDFAEFMGRLAPFVSLTVTVILATR